MFLQGGGMCWGGNQRAGNNEKSVISPVKRAPLSLGVGGLYCTCIHTFYLLVAYALLLFLHRWQSQVFINSMKNKIVMLHV